MEILEAKDEIRKLEIYIELMEGYKPTTIKQEAIKLYVLKENVTVVASELNNLGYRTGGRKYLGKDISNWIRQGADDEIHELAKKIFKSNKKKSSKFR